MRIHLWCTLACLVLGVTGLPHRSDCSRLHLIEGKDQYLISQPIVVSRAQSLRHWFGSHTGKISLQPEHNVQNAQGDTATPGATEATSQRGPSLCQSHVGLTVYELLMSIKGFRFFREWIDQDQELVQILNSTLHTFTVFAPTNRAFESWPEGETLTSDNIKYHLSPHVYSLKSLLATYTIDTVLNSTGICDHGCPARLRVGSGPSGPDINFEPLVITNIVGKNGVIYGIDSILSPPPSVGVVIDRHKSSLSVFGRALRQTGFHDILASETHAAGTVFAPTDEAFEMLGSRTVDFLFSPNGTVHLRQILSYHIVPYWSLFSNGIYPLQPDANDISAMITATDHLHVNLLSSLKEKSLSVDLGKLSAIRIDAFTSVSVRDLFASDGVVHTIDQVLFPPNQLELPDQQ